jgi:hypothetical protein
MYYYLYIKEIMNSQQQSTTIGLPDNFDSLDKCLKSNLIQYLNQLDPIEKKAYKIAKEHLGSSFNIVKSNGFCDWLKERVCP